MHAHFLFGSHAFLWTWVCLCCTPSVVWSLDPETTTQRKQQRTDSQPDKPPRATTLPAETLPAATLTDTSLAENRQQLSARGSAVFAGGCFWCIESDLEKVPGVIDVISGYSGGRTRNPTYQTYASGGHREVVFVVYDPSQITYAGLVEYLIKHIDPTNRMGQFKDTGRQYGPAIYYSSPAEKLAAQQVVAAIDQMNIFRRELNVVIEQRQAFWPAEEYHQNYHVKNLRKYQFYRAASGRDAFLQQHWGQRAGQLELTGAFPTQPADSGGHSTPGAGFAADLGGSSLPAQAPGDSGEGERPLSEQDSATVSQETLAGEPAWLSFQKPSPQALRQVLTPMQYRVTQHDETEPAFQNRYWNHHRSGIYVDVVSGEPLFSSADKYESGTGWPTFVAPVDAQAVRYTPDNKLSYTRIEVRSSRGDSHLGHLFNDGPPQRGGKRYCLNSAALRFIPQEEMAEQGYADYLSLVGH